MLDNKIAEVARYQQERSKSTFDLNTFVTRFDRSLSNSKSQMYDQDQDQEKDTDSGDHSKDFSLTVMENEQMSFDIIKKQQEDKDIINQNDNIFKHLVNEHTLKKLSTNNKCSICYDEFNLIRQKRQWYIFEIISSKFCGETVCDKHGRKKRGDPQDPISFNRICDVCEDKYIKLSVQENYIMKKNDLSNQLQELERLSNLITTEVRNKQDLLQQQKSQVLHFYKYKMQTQQNTIKNSQNELTFKIQKIRQQNAQIKQEAVSMEDRVKKLDNQIAGIIERQSLKEQSINTKLKLDNEKRNQISAVDQDIKQINHLTEQINVDITEKKISQDRKQELSEKINQEIQLEQPKTIYETYAKTDSQSSSQVRSKKSVKPIEEHIEDREFCKKCMIF